MPVVVLMRADADPTRADAYRHALRTGPAHERISRSRRNTKCNPADTSLIGMSQTTTK